MDTSQSKGGLNIALGKLRRKWAVLTANDRHYFEGMQEELLARIQKRNGQRREAAEPAIKESSSSGSE